MGYHCQNCQTQIVLDDSLRDLSEQQLHLLVSRSTKPPPLPSVPPSNYIPPERLERYNRAVLLGAVEAQLRSLPLSQEAGSSFGSQRLFVYVSDAEDDLANSEEEKDPTESNFNKESTSDGAPDDQLPDFSKVKSLRHVFRILLTNQDVSHPMCRDCANLLTENYKFKFDHSQHEKEQYASFLKKLKERSSTLAPLESALDAKLTDADNELKQLKELEQEKLSQLETLESSHADLLKRIALLDARLKDLNENQLSELFRTKNTFNAKLEQEQMRLDQAKALYKKHLNQLDRLRSFNVFSRLFEILFDSGDGYGRINKCRLGYRVPWPELNVSLGHVARLIVFLMKRLGVETYPYEIVPLGLKSYIIKHGSKADALNGDHPSELARSETLRKPHSASGRHETVLPLYSSNEFTLGKLFNYNAIDVSMLALLDILSHFERNLVQRDEGLAFPYVISIAKGTIGGRSIRISSNGPWTDACRFLLTDLNWILSYVSAQPAPES